MMNDGPSQVLTDITEQLLDLYEVEGRLWRRVSDATKR